MFQKIAEKFTSFLIYKGVADQGEKDVFEYGIVLSLTTLAGMLSVLVVSILFKWYWGFLFLIVYTPLRVYCGGHHCKTYISCFIVTNIVFLLNAVSIRLFCSLPFAWSIATANIMIFLSYAFIIWRAPVSNAENPLSSKKRAANRRKSIMIATVETCIALILMPYSSSYLFFKECYFIIASSETTVLVLMILQKIKERSIVKDD